MSENIPRVIKRYAYRKLYDTRDSRYVTLDQISEMIRRGDEVQVIDNSSKEDLTSVTLAQIVFEEEKRQRSFLPLSALRKIIQTGGESIQDLVSQITDSAEKVGRVFRKDGELVDGENVVGDDTASAEGQAAVSEGGEDASSSAHPANVIREFVDGVQETMDSWQKRFDTSVQTALDNISPLAPLQKEVATLSARIVELEEKLSKLEG
jgi:polyhydroxyalkanoate synthesis repressor PhaR